MTDRKDDVEMPDEIFIYPEKHKTMIVNQPPVTLTHGTWVSFDTSGKHVKYQRADKAEPAIDVEGLKKEIATEMCGGFDTSLRCDTCEAISETIDHLASRNLIRTPREPIEGLEEALDLATHYNCPDCGSDFDFDCAIYQAAKRYHEGE